jgi:hypothetical protein
VAWDELVGRSRWPRRLVDARTGGETPLERAARGVGQETRSLLARSGDSPDDSSNAKGKSRLGVGEGE